MVPERGICGTRVGGLGDCAGQTGDRVGVLGYLIGKIGDPDAVCRKGESVEPNSPVGAKLC